MGVAGKWNAECHAATDLFAGADSALYKAKKAAKLPQGDVGNLP